MRKRYTDEYLIRKVIEQTEKLGRTPNSSEFPYIGSVKWRFGTWNHFLELAGLQANKNRRKPEESKQICIETLQSWIKENGTVPTSTEWDQLGIFPSLGAINHHFGTWGKFLEEAGIHRIPKLNKEYLIKLAQEEYKSTGEIPVLRQFPHITSVMYQFGTWNAFLECAGIPLRFERRNFSDWTNEQLIERYREVSSQYGKPLPSTMFEHYDIPPFSVYFRRFGTINELRKQAGFPTKERSSKYTDEMIRDILISLYQKFGRRLTIKEMDEHSPIPLCTILRKMKKTSLVKLWDEVETWIEGSIK